MTYKNATIGVVIPAYNEEALVGDVIEGLPEFVDRVYPVDDCSTDDTWDVIQDAAELVNEQRAPTAPYGEVVVPIRHERNRGAGGAAITGYRQALSDGVTVVASVDGDGQMDPSFLPSLLDPVVEGRVIYAKGNRLASVEYADEMSSWRLFGNVLLTGLSRIASGYWRLQDPQNGYTAISADALESIDLGSLYESYGFRNDVLVHLNVEGCRIADVSHPARYGEEVSDIQYRSFIPRLSWLLLRRFWWRLGQRYRRHGDPAVLTAFLGGVAGIGVSVVELLSALLTRRSDRRPNTPVGDGRYSVPDGGTETSSNDGNSPASGPSLVTVVVSLLLVCLGVVLDFVHEESSVVRIDGEPHLDDGTDDG